MAEAGDRVTRVLEDARNEIRGALASRLEEALSKIRSEYEKAINEYERRVRAALSALAEALKG